MTQPALDWDKLGRYLAGESPPEEAAAVRRWLEEHSSDAQVIEALDRVTKQASPQRPIDVEAALQRVKTRGKAKSPRRFESIVGRFEGIAAAAAILLVAGTLLFPRSSDDASPGSVARTYATGVGKRDSVALDDGSWIILGPASQVVVRDREVDLQGEAYFSIRHDTARPFTVRAGNAVIRDVGTEFSVHSDSTEPVRVVVKEGAVQLTHQRDSVTLLPGDVGRVELTGRVAANRGAATSDDMAWTSGRLVFRNASVTELAADLRRWYGVELRVDSALLRRHFSGPFVGESRDRVLEVIALAFGARVDWRGDTAFVRIARPNK